VIFRKGYIYEILVEIEKGEKNFAPMGIKYIGTKNKLKMFEVFAFNNTKTAHLLTENLKFKAVFTSNIQIFYECITKDFSRNFYSKIRKFPCINLNVEKIERFDDGIKAICSSDIDKNKEKKIKENLINRAKYLTLESLIYYTKPISNKEKMDKISECLRVIKKVAPGSLYEKIVNDIISKWMKKIN